jgi:hypothetical protein
LTVVLLFVCKTSLVYGRDWNGIPVNLPVSKGEIPTTLKFDIALLGPLSQQLALNG